MSKTQEKKAARLQEAAEFVGVRRTIQYQILLSNFNVGVRMFEANKEKLSQEERDLLQVEMEKQWALLEQIKKDFGVDLPT